jgi:hypothetical protein
VGEGWGLDGYAGWELLSRVSKRRVGYHEEGTFELDRMGEGVGICV